MKKKLHFKCWLLFYAILASLYHSGMGQTTFPLVGVPETNLTVDLSVEKVFTTSVRLFPVTTAIFNSDQFINFVMPYYSSALNGFVSITNVLQTTVPAENTWQVSYQISYVYDTMVAAGADDSTIANTIGNYEAVTTNVGGSPTFDNVYQFDSRNFTFLFGGLSLCNSIGVRSCEANTVCDEVLSGVTLMCVSPCKQQFCQNGGTCAQVSTAVVPTCTCTSTSDTWHIGLNCETKVTLWMIIVPVVIGLLLILFAILIACCCYRKKKKQKEKESMLFDASKDTTTVTKTNEAFVEDEEKKAPVDFIPREGFEERDVDAALSRIRSRSSSRDRRSRHRRHSSEYSRRDRRESRSPHRSSRRRSENDEDSFESDSSGSQNDIDVMKAKNAAPLTSARGESRSYDHLHGHHQNRHSERRHSETPSDSFSQEESSYDESDDVTSNDVSVREKGTSPIRWMPTSKPPSVNNTKKMGKIDIAQRKGWMPSLGPQMFDLGSQENVQDDTLPVGTKLSPYVAETDI